MSYTITFPSRLIGSTDQTSHSFYYAAKAFPSGAITDGRVNDNYLSAPNYMNSLEAGWSNDSSADTHYAESFPHTWSHWSSVFGGGSPPFGGTSDYVHYWELSLFKQFFRIPQLDKLPKSFGENAITKGEIQIKFSKFPYLKIEEYEHEVETDWTLPGPGWVLDSPGYDVLEGGGLRYWNYRKITEHFDIDDQSWTLGLYGAKVNQTTGIIEITPLPAGDTSFLLDHLDPMVVPATNLCKEYLKNRVNYTAFLFILYPEGIGYDPLAIPAEVIIDATYTGSLSDSGYTYNSNNSGTCPCRIGTEEFKSLQWDNPIRMEGRVDLDASLMGAIGSGMVYEEIPANILQ